MERHSKPEVKWTSSWQTRVGEFYLIWDVTFDGLELMEGAVSSVLPGAESRNPLISHFQSRCLMISLVGGACIPPVVPYIDVKTLPPTHNSQLHHNPNKPSMISSVVLVVYSSGRPPNDISTRGCNAYAWAALLSGDEALYHLVPNNLDLLELGLISSGTEECGPVGALANAAARGGLPVWRIRSLSVSLSHHMIIRAVASCHFEASD